MSYSLFGAKSTLLTYTGTELAFSPVPNAEEPGKAPAHTYFAGVLNTVTEIHELVVSIAAAADRIPLPEQPRSLQELVQAGRGRLAREQAQRDRGAWGIALEHVSLLEERLRP